ncbi:VOC family protein [Streptomyces sp. NPDC059452]|uniref:VOC family protein n=1 Tax=Streptomyces sp. NPDC059452 TaxID=3346835 RepID=UPI0036BA3C84
MGNGSGSGSAYVNGAAGRDGVSGETAGRDGVSGETAGQGGVSGEAAGRGGVSGLHHVGHVVADLGRALELYRRLGFTLPPPGVPALARREGEAPEPFGAANTHADFARGFVELATVVRPGGGSLPPDARLVPLEAPPEVLPQLVRRIGETSTALGALLDRFEGVHILMLAAPDIDAAASRLTAGGQFHGGVNTVRRPVRTGEGGTVTETVRYLELDGEGPGARGRVAEGRVGVVAELDPEIQATRVLGHPNGAVGLVDAVLCVADEELEAWQQRYGARLGRPDREVGPARVFGLGADGGSVTLVPASGLPAVLPGERAPVLPALVAYTVAVRDLTATRELLEKNGFGVRRAASTASGDVFVPAAEALGAAVVFRQA